MGNPRADLARADGRATHRAGRTQPGRARFRACSLGRLGARLWTAARGASHPKRPVAGTRRRRPRQHGGTSGPSYAGRAGRRRIGAGRCVAGRCRAHAAQRRQPARRGSRVRGRGYDHLPAHSADRPL